MRDLVTFFCVGILCLFQISKSEAQQCSKPESLRVIIEMVNNGQQSLVGLPTSPGSNPMANISSDTPQKVVFLVKASNQVNISKVHVKLGTSQGTGDILEMELNYNGQSLPAGVSVVNQGEFLRIELGEYTGIQNFYAEVRFEDINGDSTFPVSNSNVSN